MHTRPYEKLIAWQRAYGLCLLIYKRTKSFPTDERFGLISQMRRSAYGVPLNLAEGNAKRSSKEKRHFFEFAQGSLEELHCQSRLSKDLGYIDDGIFHEIDDHINRVSFLLVRLQASIK
jgi:four helix bundle protein